MENSDHPEQQDKQQKQVELHEKEEEQLNYIEETVPKKRKSNKQWAIRRKQQLLEKKWQLKKDKKLSFKRAEEFVKEYRNKELDFVNMKHKSKRMTRDIAVNSLSKPIFVIRIQGKSDIHPQIKKTLYTLGLKRIYSGVFLRASADNLALLQKVKPFVTYGYPDLQNVRALIKKKGSLKIDKEKVPLNDNNIIEQISSMKFTSLDQNLKRLLARCGHLRSSVYKMMFLKARKIPSIREETQEITRIT